MRKDHPSEPRPNRYSAKCCHCGNRVEAGEGATEKVMGTPRDWRTYHIPCDQKARPDDYEVVSEIGARASTQPRKRA